MSPDRLLAHFERISEAPDAVPRLRRFILDLAVRGKLVEQDPGDEPASELLKRIQAEKARLVKEGKIRKQPQLPAIDSANTPFIVPKHWAWLQLDGIGVLSGGMTPSKNRSEFWEGSINWFSPKDIKADELVNSELKITAIGMAETGLQLYPPGCLFMVARSGILKRTFPVSINRVEATANQDLKVLAPFMDGLERYLQIMFRGMTGFILSALVKTGTTVQSLKYEEFESQPFPLPPLAEQRRIVAKVDELMALCDRLAAAQAERERRRDRLAAASLHRLNTGADAESFRAHARFHLRHLPRLTTRPELIQQLRQTILNLAVRGQLVPQDLNDEPASELLKRIDVEKARLVKQGAIKKEKPFQALQPEKAPFEIPESWKWTRLGELTKLITKGSSPKWQGVAYVSKNDGILFVTSENVGSYRLRKMDEPKYVEKRFNEIEPRSILRFGDILMNLVGASIGRTAVYDLHDEANINQAVALIRFVNGPSNLCASFLLHYFNSPSAIQLMLASRVVTAQPNMSLTDAREFPVPTPPLAEQHRIVAKVEELMALCSQLTAQLTTTQNESHRLLEAVLHEALASSSNPSMQRLYGTQGKCVMGNHPGD